MAQSLYNLPIGAKVKFGKHSINGETAQPIIWRITAKNHAGYPSDSVTLLADKIIDLRAFDGAESNVPGSSQGVGNNDYGLSNVDAWLNSELSSWYVSKHTYDTPPNNSNVQNGTGYDNRPGFLSNFTISERNAILASTISVTKYGGTIESLSRKVFLPSFTELGMTSASEPTNGLTWSYFSTATCEAALTEQCFNNTLSTLKPSDTTTTWSYWLRSVSSTGAAIVYYAFSTRSMGQTVPHSGMQGVRPALNLSSFLTVSNTTDSDGCYTFEWNLAPPAPTPLTVPAVYGGKSITISWGKSTDPDGNTVTYQLESSVDGGEFTTIYSGGNLAHSLVIPIGTTSVKFRVKAVDSLGASSDYTSSTMISVINNNPPVISGSDGNLGIKSSEFSLKYRITDTNSDAVIVTEYIDGVQIRSYLPALNVEQTLDVLGNTWVALGNGNHTLTIVATDGIDSVTRTVTFTKAMTSFTIQTINPMPATTRPTRIKLSIGRAIPAGATFKVYVCNNGFDSEKHWEDATSAVIGGLVHVFTNTDEPSAGKWGVLIKVEVDRNNAAGECYVSSIGGNFE